MATLTTKYGWVKPTVGGDPSTWGTEINADLDAIDAVMNATRPGVGGTPSGHTYNIDWTGSVANLWIEATNEGAIITSAGGTINGALTVGGTITCPAVNVVGNGNLAYECNNSAGAQLGAFYWEAATSKVVMSNFTGSGGSIAIDAGGNCQLPGNVTSGHGWTCRAGTNGATSNLFNIYWDGAVAQLWIDGTNEGNIITSTGGTINGSLAVAGSVTSNATVAAASVSSTGGVHADADVTASGNVTAGGNVTGASFGAANNITASNGAYYGSDSGGAVLNCAGGGAGLSFRWASPWGYFRINNGAAEMTIATGNARNLSYATGTGGPTGVSLNGNAASGTLYGTYCDAVCDERIKQNIKPTSVDALKIVNAIPIDEFEIKAPVVGWMAAVNEPERAARARMMGAAKPRHVPIGLVAQKLQALIPEAVYASADDRPPEDSPLPPNVLTLADAQLTPYLLRAIQQLTERVQTLEARLAA